MTIGKKMPINRWILPTKNVKNLTNTTVSVDSLDIVGVKLT